MRIYVSADIEGIGGVVSLENSIPGRFEYEQARDWMTDAVLSACEVAHEMGADEVVVSDSHGPGQNIRYERMPAYVQLVRSWPRPLGMMQGVEAGEFAGAFLVGYHAGATNKGGVLAHTLSGELIQEVRLNGRNASEAVISAAIAGHFNVPVLLIVSDDVGVTETVDMLGDIATATMKTSYGRLSALNPSPSMVDARLREGVRDAMSRIGTVAPYVIEGPIDLDLRLRTRFVAEWLDYLESVERLDAFTIRYRAQDMLDVSRFLIFLCFARSVLG